MAEAPARGALPASREFSDEFRELRGLALVWLASYYDRDHLERAGDWLAWLEPAASEALLLAALMHDLERAVPGGPALDKASQPWDDPEYNRAHCERSADVVSAWLAELGASAALVEGVRQPIREHEFGGSPDGDLMQAADSISFLETNGALVAGWIARGECSDAKGRAKLRWMADRVRLARARPIAAAQLDRVLAEVDQRLAAAPR